MHFTTIKQLLLTGVLALTTTSVSAQDLIARQAPVDRKATKVDTFALRTVIEREQAASPAANLYTEWSNKYAHRATTLPDSFNIDLRRFAMPTDNRVITSQFGRRWGRMHKGLDIKVYIGDTIRSAFDGKVRIVKYEAAGYGNYVVIRHPNGLETIYGHMSKHLVNENQQVRAGDPIGLGGNTGRSTGSHLHFETRLCGVALNPALMFDFKNQDVTGDFYKFRRSSYVKESEIANRCTGNKNDSGSPVVNTKATASIGETTKARATVQKEVASANETSRVSSSRSRNSREVAQKQKNDRRNKRSQELKKPRSTTHTVSSGETLYSIARKNGTTVDKLYKLNGLKKDAVIRPGQKIKCS